VHQLDGCRAKLDWAERHLDALSAEIKSFMERDAYALPTEFDEADKSTVVRFKESRELPATWGLAIGDVIQNTRSALDHLVYQLVLLANFTPHDVHQFPILDQPQDWVRRVQKPPKGRRGLLDGIDPTHVASIQALQPYVSTTGLPRLAILRDFSNIDKHRVIHAARTIFTQTPKLTAQLTIPSTLTDIRTLQPGTPIDDGTEIARFRAHTDLRFPSASRIQPQGRGGIWTPGEMPMLNIDGAPEDAQMKVDAKLRVTTVFGAPGVTYTRGREFRHALADVRTVVESFAPAFS
jgi:hypothetical protein